MVTPTDPYDRVQYEVPGLAEHEVAADPLQQFQSWLHDAVAAGTREPTAMSLATTGAAGPTVRVVLAKSVDAAGVSFYTNLESAKARDLATDPRCAVVWAWLPLHRQVRMTGTAAPVARDVVADYWQSRPRGAQLGAWASPQSQVLAGRDELSDRLVAVESRYTAADVPVPPQWGGFLIRPTTVEFWQGQPSRLHDRIRFDAVVETAQLDRAADWRRTRLAP